MENRRLTESIRTLFEGFVEAAVTAIEQRDPTTSGHSHRVAALTCALAQAADRAEDGPYAAFRIGRDELREIRYAAVLHDFGKVGVREQVLVKARKLSPGGRELIRARFEQALLVGPGGGLGGGGAQRRRRRRGDGRARAAARGAGGLLEAGRARGRARRCWRPSAGADLAALRQLEFRAGDGHPVRLLTEGSSRASRSPRAA